ncbi:PC-esterase domain-containing protein 1A isoform X2 [Amia ocellicauda]|uniref:PC-esterase domain-containing protein 1A isoform X2 n=1 Tax=Amia ocellicauda TaxID=2972642 RepID=UPI00346447B8
MKCVNQDQARRLLHNKFVVVLGDSIQRSVYKDLVVLLQRDSYLSVAQLKCKGELNFEQDCLVEGGKMGQMTNGTEYKEVRQFRTPHHLVRFYFLTQIYSNYMESILSDFKAGPQPDVLVVNSCVWDVSRYGGNSMTDYRENLNMFFIQLKKTLLPECLVIWNMTMPLGMKITGGFLVPEIQHLGQSLRMDIIEANFYSATLADSFGFDVLDLHYHFRFSLQHRMRDGVHWNQLAHRRISFLLLEHIAEAWGVELPDSQLPNNSGYGENTGVAFHHSGTRDGFQPRLNRGPAAGYWNLNGRLGPPLMNSYNEPPRINAPNYSGLCRNHNRWLRPYSMDPYMQSPVMNFNVSGQPRQPTCRYQNPPYRYGSCNTATMFNPFFHNDSPLIGTTSNPRVIDGYISFEENNKIRMKPPEI